MLSTGGQYESTFAPPPKLFVEVILREVNLFISKSNIPFVFLLFAPLCKNELENHVARHI